ncbi:MAG: hypothetical protein F2866_06570 [Actinobacteria bacterium]|uniref:Unannotated protein n=1 Tax=freshwater metagenome TaxID=449393 RepID=A0A6J7BZ00_9ZZZZ|nr:hypothetical protein [Actinomycetota bacterium]MSX29833.1 hypothetical protein [Actinomycetota bacterium]MSX43844.1 hypothetical protein [Actinomycetota bacterium]MSX97869.1 hypothetical protein [Actinomycetota bacterium]MSZ79607.1 hypothetical protein [Actinomycetota bacterium]
MLKTQNRHKVRALVALSAVLALALTGCSGSSASDAQSAVPSATTGTAGPPVWSAEETEYLGAISGADLASSIFLSASDYITIGDTVCNGLKQDIPLEDILSALASSGKKNGLNATQRNEFTLITSAAAVSFLCKDQIEKYKLQK